MTPALERLPEERRRQLREGSRVRSLHAIVDELVEITLRISHAYADRKGWDDLSWPDQVGDYYVSRVSIGRDLVRSREARERDRT